jgi:hypothetical protein
VADKVSVGLRGSHQNSRTARYACERRGSKRLLCSDLVQVRWNDDNGRECGEIAILENLSLAGVGLFTGVPIPQDVTVRIRGHEKELVGRVKQCAFRENGYIVGLELDPDSQWAQQPGQEFMPQHLLDVSLLDLD